MSPAERWNLPAFVRNKAATPVVAVHCLDDVDAAVAVAADVEETAVSGQVNWTQPPLTIDEGDLSDLVSCNAVQEAIAGTSCDSSFRRQELP